MEILAQAVLQGLLIGSTYAIIALSMGMVFRVSGVVNFAHGDLMTLSMFAILALQGVWGLDPYALALITVPMLVLLGAPLYWFLIRPLAGRPVTVIQLTLGLMLIIQNLLLMIYGGEFQRVTSVFEHQFVHLGQAIVLRLPQVIAFGVTVFVAGTLYLVLGFTDFGRSVRAVHQNARAAALIGIDVTKVERAAFSIGMALLALAAALLIPGMPLHPADGLRYTLAGLLPFVLGGMSNFLGILVSGLVIGIAESIGAVYISGTTGMALPYAIFALILLFRPQGLFKGHG